MTPTTFLYQAVANQAATDLRKVLPSSRLGDDLGLDSLDLLELVMALEKEFKITIDETALPPIETMAQANTVLLGLLQSAK